MAVGQMRGEIIGSKYREHAMRFVPDCITRPRLTIEAALRSAVGISLDRDINLVNDGFDFVTRFPQWLARFASDTVGKIFQIGLHPASERPDYCNPVTQRSGGPIGPSSSSGSNSRIDITGRAAPQLGPCCRFVGYQFRQIRYCPNAIISWPFTIVCRLWLYIK